MILVTGGTGYVGSGLVPALVQRGESVRLLLRTPAKERRLADLPNVEFVRGDVGDIASLERALQGVTAVIHLVAIIRERGSRTFQAVNFQGTVNLVEAANRAGVKRFLHMSALKADSRSPYPYLRSKGQARDYVRSSGLDFTVFEPSVIFGEGDEFVNTLAGVVKLGPIVPVPGSGKAPFQPIWIGDVVACFLKSLEMAETIGQTYELAGPRVYTYDELIDLICRVLSVKRLKLHLPLALMGPLVTLMDNVLPQPPATPGQLALLAVGNAADSSAVTSVFGIVPRAMEEGIDYIRHLTLGRFIRRTLGKTTYAA